MSHNNSGQAAGNVLTASEVNELLKVESDGSSWLDGPLGVGTSSPLGNLHATILTSTTAGAETVITLGAISSGTPAAGFGSSLRFQSEGQDNDGVEGVIGTIASVLEGSGSGSTQYDGGLRFFTREGGGLNERMRINSVGHIGIGNNSINNTGFSTEESVLTLGSQNDTRQGILELLGHQTVDGDIGKIVFYNDGVARICQIIGLRKDENNSGELSLSTSNSGSITIALIIDKSQKLIVGASGSLTNQGDILLNKDGVLAMKETTTPTADTDFGKTYTKTDNKLYFQDGAGVEHEVAFV